MKATAAAIDGLDTNAAPGAARWEDGEPGTHQKTEILGALVVQFPLISPDCWR